MNTQLSDPTPQRVLTPRRKRAFLSFRRKTDLVWFITTLVLFSVGITAFFLATVFLARSREPIPALEKAAATSSHHVEAIPAPRASPRNDENARRPAEATVPPEKNIPAPKPEEKQKSVPPASRRAEDKRRPAEPTPSLAPKEETANRGYFLLREAGPFQTLAEGAARITVEPTRSMGEKAIQVNYDLSNGEWVQWYVDIRGNFSKYSHVQFLFMGEGSDNTLEFKLVDSDGTNVGASWAHQTGRKAWTVVDLRLSDLTYLWGGDSTLDLRRVRQIFFAISKKRGDNGGRGRVTIRGVRFS